MDEAPYTQCASEQKAGLRKQAKATIRRFVESFAGLEEKLTWTRCYLAKLKPGELVRHELYEGVVFPVLLAGYERRDPWSLYWLAETCQSRYREEHLRRGVISESPLDLFKEAYALSPRSELIRSGLLRFLMRGLHYITHEWPSGILYQPDKPWQTQYLDVLEDIRLARELDESAQHGNELAEYEAMISADCARRGRRSSLR